MRHNFRYIILTAAAVLLAHGAVAQGCNLPEDICQSEGAVAFSTSVGTTTPASNDCFDVSNSIFIAFNTLNQNYLVANDIGFVGNATINISLQSCDTTLTGASVTSATVVSASNLCNSSTYSQPLDCVPVSTNSSLSLSLSDLMPDTTYYLIINTASVDGDAVSCDLSVEINGPAVTYQLDPTADPTTIFSGATTVLTGNPGFDSYEWQGDNLQQTSGQQTSVTLEEEGQNHVYTLTGQVDGCTLTEQVLVRVVPALQVRNTITPNGDGINDTWTIQGIHRFPDAEVRVYSRWGQTVFRARNYTPWDGDNLPAGVYYYVIDLNPLGYDTRPYTGYLTIIR